MRRLAHALLVLLILPALVTGQVTVTTGGSVDVTASYSFTGTETFAGQTNISGPKANTNVEIGSITSGNANAGTGGFSTVVGGGSASSGNGVSTTIFGSTNTQSAGTNGIIIGVGNSSGFGSSTLIAVSGTTTAANQFVAGSSTVPVNNVYFGKGVTNATATTYTLNGTGGTGADNGGGSLVLAPGIGTGAAIGGPLILNRNLVGASSSTPQTQGTAWVSCPSKILSNTTGTAQTIATITTTSTTAGAVNMFYTVTASNGTVLDADSGEAQVAWNNNAGTVAATMAAAIGGANSAASGTLATAPTATNATNVVSIKFTPAWTVIVPTVVTGYATFAVNGVNSIACQ